MPCFTPRPAWRDPQGAVSLRRPTDVAFPWQSIELPCGACEGCMKRDAASWSLRMLLELEDHDHACWCTLTYDENSVPASLQKHHVSAWIKRLRAHLAPQKLRFFACGEYGETTQRPHYHCVLYGVRKTSQEIQTCWPHGFVRTDPITPAAIAYVAGYVNKKLLGWPRDDPRAPPFRLMSRNPGIGASARTFTHAWRTTAVWQGTKVPVPRYFHNAWLKAASDDHKKQLLKEQIASWQKKLKTEDHKWERKRDAQQIEQARINLNREKRKKYD